MHGAFLTGLVLGLILAVMTSPAFFALINITSTKGPEAGGMFVAGIFTSNLFLFLASIISFNLIEYEFQLQRIIIITIAALLFLICVLILLNLDRKLISKRIIFLKATTPLSIYSKGILMNILNPVTIIFWLGILMFYFIKIDDDKNEFVFYLLGVITIILIFDLLKLLSSNIFNNKINPLHLLFLNKVIAVGIIVTLAYYFL